MSYNGTGNSKVTREARKSEMEKTCVLLQNTENWNLLLAERLEPDTLGMFSIRRDRLGLFTQEKQHVDL
jgi:hypothetical protein